MVNWALDPVLFDFFQFTKKEEKNGFLFEVEI